MKRLLPLLLLLLSFSSKAQNYACFVPDTIQYYTNNDGYVRGIRIDSVHTVGNEVIYYPFKTIRGYYENMVEPLDSTGGSWVGSKVIQKDGGVTLFDNHWGDTVFINTQASLGDQWIFYHHFSSPYFYSAEVTALDTMSFLGYTDSVKKVRITSFDLFNINFADSLNGFEIILSKSHGFVEAFDLYMFPYHPHDSSFTFGRDLFTDQVVNYSTPRRSNSQFMLSDYNFIKAYHQQDWNVNDIYEYSSKFMTDIFSSYPPNYALDTIDQVNIIGNTTEYITSGWYGNFWLNMGQYAYNYSYHTNTPFDNNCYLCPQVQAVPMPEEKWQELFWYYFPHNTSHCMNTPLYRFLSTRIMYDNMIVNTFEPDGFIAEYKGGLGTTYVKYTIGGTTTYSERTMVYHKRGNNTCGSVVAPLGVENVSLEGSAVRVYPNPASTELHINAPVKDLDIGLLNIVGQTVYTEQNFPTERSIDISTLPNAIYQLKLQMKDHPVVFRKIMVQH